MMYGDVPWPSAREIYPLISVPGVTVEDTLTRTLVVPGVSWEDVPIAEGSVVLPIAVGSIPVLAILVLVAWRAGIIPRGDGRQYGRRLSGSARYGVAFAGLGIASLGGWFVRGGEPSSPLLYFGGVGLFGGVLAPLLLSGQTVSPVVAEGLHEALVSTTGRDKNEPSGATVYYPGQDGSDPLSVRVYTLDTEEYDPDATEDASSSVALNGPLQSRPSGAVLYQAFRAEAISEIATDPETFAWQLCQGLTDWLELVGGATLTATTTNEITIRVTGSSVPGVGRFDHPVVSFLGVGLACNREHPIVVTAQSSDVGSREYGISIHPFAGAPPQPTEDDPTTRDGSHDGNSNGSRRGTGRSGAGSNDEARGGTR